MDFLQALINEQEILTDAEVEQLISDIDVLDEDAFDRIDKRVSSREIAMYALLVGRSNALRAKMFKDRSLEGKASPTNLIDSYAPVFELINDIVQAGPSYITLLKNLHQRAKKRQ